MSSKTLRTRFSLVLLAMSLAGCANYSGLTTEGVSLDAKSLKAGQSLSGVTLSPAAWPKSDWWKSLGDPQLDGLIREALHDSPDMQIASARAHQASAAAYAADAARMPTLDASGSVSRSRLSRSQDPRGQGDNYSTLRSLTGTFNYTFDLWGGQRDTWEAALGQARAAEIDRQAAQLTLAADVARAYSDLGQAHIVHDLADEDLKRTRQMLELSQKRLSSGIDSQYQYQQTESLEASSEASLIDAEKNLQSAKIALAVLLGKGPDRGNDIARPKVLQASAVALPSVLPAELLGRRPDLVAARWRVEAASKSIDAGKTNFYPNLNLSAAAGTQALLGDAMFGSASRFFNIAPTVSLPIFDGGRLRADLDARDADYDLAVAQYNKSLVNALGDVSDTISQLRDIGRQIAAQQHATDIAQDSYDTVVQRYGSGIGNYLDVLSIEQQLLQAQRQLATLNAQQIDLSIQLMQALGGGFQTDNLAAATPTPASRNQ
ncbi:Outer membrane factor (OMF) lipoprotein associated wth EmrAB-OMF efflux system [Pseudomonas chlororaphis subsp. aureofaciens]|uniref:Outer membrane factor (OMF) lipoprotein associated wth EmrAB-OMF efflux system n=1 Tax=Pseudomonas chlororaphis subsp. aureofaciens TaxID=587851 RepID=A0AAD0ZKS6_9PSED|nr:efflux transporter outer membrane subunit [Pseudomonas chlororaphis]AIC21044.1 multidrug RND transporter [Pseudomonas chlororaphis]AZE18261.1 Outer membrane factor (OMF) lipoprotein associated wth EmrAB-OMF efflux system [Pseudomonas chlororaphis subsp. aureofaciens]AZE24481.1 Outer membrane factor (OMF) lipoprotein associated wth EmrAB-OMF efflux system [Pseudomonas chlororaphis subsp. aureofaciens]AZE30762.1 Outer membrane factor (OMF) lipoprotein associated wth EmrAB-OMF efflux system [Ps